MSALADRTMEASQVFLMEVSLLDAALCSRMQSRLTVLQLLIA